MNNLTSQTQKHAGQDTRLGRVPPFLRDLYAVVRRMPGAGRLSRALVHRVLAAGHRVWVEVPDGAGGGCWLLLDSRYEETASYSRAAHGPEIQALLREVLKPGDVFYDVGAHFGFYSFLAAGLVGPRGDVRCFEPDPDNFARLQQHMHATACLKLKRSTAPCGRKAAGSRFTERPHSPAGLGGR